MRLFLVLSQPDAFLREAVGELKVVRLISVYKLATNVSLHKSGQILKKPSFTLHKSNKENPTRQGAKTLGAYAAYFRNFEACSAKGGAQISFTSLEDYLEIHDSGFLITKRARESCIE